MKHSAKTIKTKIGIIIQGPLVTFGNGPNNVKSGFNALASILINARAITHQSYSFVLSSWFPTSALETEILDELRRKRIPILLHKQPTIDDPYNGYKQRLSMKYGYQFLNKLGVNYFVKIRTDMVMPSSFWRWLKSQANSNPESLLVSELLRDEPYYLGDFVVGGSQKVFNDYCAAILSHKSKIFLPVSTYDVGLKYLQKLGAFNFESKRWQLLKTYQLFMTQSNKLRLIWNDFLQSKVVVLPLPIWKQIIWRGKSMDTVVDSRPFKFDVLPELRTKSMWSQFRLITSGSFRLWDKRNTDSKQVFRIGISRTYQALVIVWAIFQNRITILINKVFNLFNRPLILGRFSCIGRDVLKATYPKYRYQIVNHQKVRLDMLMAWVHGQPRPKSNSLQKYILRKDIFPLIQNQEQLPWLTRKIPFDFLLIDSYSELTDKKFTHKQEKWSFCCHYSDVDHTGEFDKLFTCVGLLPEAKLERTYRQFFSWFEQQFPLTKVVFIHSPADLDTRPEYRRRAKKIRTIIDRLAKTKKYLYSVHLPANKVEFSPTDSLPYHYSQKTYFAFAKKWHMIDPTLLVK